MDTSFDGAGLRAWRKRKGLRREDIATACHVSAMAVYNWESGRSNPHPAVLPTLERLMSGQIAVVPLTQVEEDILDEAVKRGQFESREAYLAASLTEVIRGTLSARSINPVYPPQLKVAEPDAEYLPKKGNGA